MQVLVPANDIVMFRLTQERFKLKNKDKLKVDPKHPAHYILVWIVYINNTYNIYRIPKNKYRKYPIRIYWLTNKK